MVVWVVEIVGMFHYANRFLNQKILQLEDESTFLLKLIVMVKSKRSLLSCGSSLDNTGGFLQRLVLLQPAEQSFTAVFRLLLQYFNSAVLRLVRRRGSAQRSGGGRLLCLRSDHERVEVL